MAERNKSVTREDQLLKDTGDLRPPQMGGPIILPPSKPGGPVPAYPILTEEMGYAPSPLANGGGPASRSGGTDRNGTSLGPIVSRALQDVLGWKVKSGDAAGFAGALNQSFSLKVVEGAVVSTWTPRSYVVQTDLSGGISGAQASIYTMAKTLLDQMSPLIDGLYPLDPASDAEDVAALKDIVHNQLSSLTTEIGYMGGPRVMRVHQYFQMVLGIRLHLDLPPAPEIPTLHPRPILTLPLKSPLRERFDGSTAARTWPPKRYWTSPDVVQGSLGDLRDQLGLSENIQPVYVNTVADEQNVTNFRIVVDYANSLLSGWSNSIQFFAGASSPFLGTQLVVISRQLGVISETVDEVRFVFDSVFIGPAQRQTIQLVFQSPTLFSPLLPPHVGSLPPIYLEDLLQWMQNFVGAEAQDIIQNGGKLGLGDDFTAMVGQLYTQAVGLYVLAQQANPPSAAMQTDRVQQALYKLVTQFGDLCTMASSVGVDYLPPRQ